MFKVKVMQEMQEMLEPQEMEALEALEEPVKQVAPVVAALEGNRPPAEAAQDKVDLFLGELPMEIVIKRVNRDLLDHRNQDLQEILEAQEAQEQQDNHLQLLE
jgi:hypothetical protein